MNTLRRTITARRAAIDVDAARYRTGFADYFFWRFLRTTPLTRWWPPSAREKRGS
ncbi:MAG: hypothetical protein HQL84_17080 [Magnetococcales bacterium]|nr:hypothetical protein [Magnetococcales bacterium]